MLYVYLSNIDDSVPLELFNRRDFRTWKGQSLKLATDIRQRPVAWPYLNALVIRYLGFERSSSLIQIREWVNGVWQETYSSLILFMLDRKHRFQNSSGLYSLIYLKYNPHLTILYRAAKKDVWRSHFTKLKANTNVPNYLWQQISKFGYL